MNKINYKLLKSMKINLNLKSTSFSCFVFKNKDKSFNNNTRYYSTITKVNEPLVITPWFITGFVDGEGSFILGLQERSDY